MGLSTKRSIGVLSNDKFFKVFNNNYDFKNDFIIFCELLKHLWIKGYKRMHFLYLHFVIAFETKIYATILELF